MCCLTIVRKNVPLQTDHLHDLHIQCSITLCDIGRFGSNQLHKLTKGLPSYILQTGAGRTDGREVYGIMRRVLLTMSLVKGRNHRGDCWCSAVPTPVREVGVGLSF